MTKEQKKKVMELLANDCEIRYQYINDEGATCAIGCLALAGEKEEEIDNFKTKLKELKAEMVICSPWLYNLIIKKHGLSLAQQRAIQEANDESGEDRSARQKAVLEVVNAFPTTD